MGTGPGSRALLDLTLQRAGSPPPAQPSPAQPPVAPAHDVSEPLEVGGCEVPVVAVTSLHVLVYAMQV